MPLLRGVRARQIPAKAAFEGLTRTADPEVEGHGPTRRRSQGESNKSLPKPKRHPEQDPGDLPVD